MVRGGAHAGGERDPEGGGGAVGARVLLGQDSARVRRLARATHARVRVAPGRRALAACISLRLLSRAAGACERGAAVLAPSLGG